MLLSDQIFTVECNLVKYADMKIIEELYPKQNKYNDFSQYYFYAMCSAIAEGNEVLVLPLIEKYTEVSKSKRFDLYKHALRYKNHIFGIVDTLFSDDINAVDEEEVSLLHLATQDGNENVMKFLLHKGAKLDATDKKGKTVFDYIPYHNPRDVVRPQVVNNIINLFVKNGADINKVDESGKTLLMRSVYGTQHIASSLIELGVKLDIVAHDGKTALHHYADDCNDTYGIAEKLISMGVNINAIDKSGRTPLHYACKCGNGETVKELLQSKARVDICDEEGNTVIDIVKSWEKSPQEYEKYKKLVPVFLENGFGSYFDISKILVEKIQYNHSWSEDKDRKICSLIESGAKVDTVDNDGKTVLHHCAHFWADRPRMIQSLIARGIDVNVVDKKGRTALHYACHDHFNIKAAKLLLQKGSDIHVGDGDGENVLFIAANSCHKHNIKSCIKMINFLLENHANPKVFDKDKRGFLHVLCEKIENNSVWDCEDELKCLLSKGVDMDAIDNNGNTPLSIATKNNNKRLVSLLKELRYLATNKGKICTKIATALPAILGVVVVGGIMAGAFFGGWYCSAALCDYCYSTISILLERIQQPIPDNKA